MGIAMLGTVNIAIQLSEAYVQNLNKHNKEVRQKIMKVYQQYLISLCFVANLNLIYEAMTRHFIHWLIFDGKLERSLL